MNASNDTRSRTSSTPATASSLRPRTRRLISGLDEGDETTYDPANAPNIRIASPLPSPYESRSASPIPARHLPRPDSSHGHRQISGANSPRGGSLRSNGRESPSLAGLWGNSWTTLQGIASDLLGSDATLETKDNPKRRRRPAGSSHGRSSTSAPPSTWGPSAVAPQPPTSNVGVGSREQREAMLRAKKRQVMLSETDSSHADALGRFKRRTSEDNSSMSAPPGENEDREALVYVHHVQRSDTLAGITIRYNISATVVRKANRMWPNDTIQVRKVIVLPVDGCGIKGKPVSGPEEVDLLSSESEALSSAYTEVTSTQAAPSSNGLEVGSRGRTDSSSTAATDRPLSSTGSSIETEPPWRHDSWVLLPNCTKPTEIARLPRRTLGYFPPARRKSQCYSDLDTPSTSLDITRTPIYEAAGHPALSPARQDAPQRPQRPRRSSNANNGYFPSYLAGPGGVGTMNKNVKNPGPAQDGLNKFFAKRLPDVAVPRNQNGLYLPDIPVYSDDGIEMPHVRSGVTTPGNVNLENVGGAIEGWVRKMAAKASTALEPTERQSAARASVGTPGRGAGGIGDLIEMADAFEIGDDEDDEEEGRGRQGSVIHIGSTTSGTSYGQSGIRSRGRSETDDTGATKRRKDN